MICSPCFCGTIQGASSQNSNLDAPLHYAATNDASLSLIQSIVQVGSSSVLLRNAVGQRPLERAQANNAPEDVIEFLDEVTERESKQVWNASFDESIPNDTAAII